MSYASASNLIRHVTLRQLQIFEAVARLGGYTRAAEALHLTQPTVSMQVKKLADAVKLPLIEQTGRTFLLTAAGQDVYRAACEVLGCMVDLEDAVAEHTGEVAGEMRIAVVTTAKYFMPHLLGAFIQRYPKVVPRLVVSNRARILQRLKRSEDELLIMGQVPEQLPVNAQPFIDNELVVVAQPGHPLAVRRNIPLSELRREHFLVRETGSGTRDAVDALLRSYGVTIEPYMELDSSETIKQGVMAGLGISVLSRHNIRLELAGGHMQVLDVEGFPLVRRWYAVTRQGRPLTHTSQTFIDFILTQGARLLSDPEHCHTPKSKG